MYLSLNLLKQLAPGINTKNIEELEKILNSIGVEVESVISFKDIKNLAIGEIISIEKPNPNAKVNLCTVKIGKETRKIICGANNIFVGAKVIIALPGAEIANGIKISEREIMGIKSQGMICGYSELNDTFCNCSDIDNAGVIILDKNATGNPLSLIGMDDTILDISIPSNRNDLNSIMWIIQEISIFYDLNFSLNKLKLPKEKNIKIQNEKILKNYFMVSFCVDDQKISWKTKYFLMNSGIKPTNFISDIALFNSLLFGFSVHAFNSKNIKKIKLEKITKDTKIKIEDYEYKILKDTICLMNQDNDIVVVPSIGVNDNFKVDANTNEISFFASEFNYMDNNKFFNTNKSIPSNSKNSLKHLSPNILQYQFQNIIELLKVQFNNIKYTWSFNEAKEQGHKLDIKKMNNILATNISSVNANKTLKLMGYQFKNGLWYQPINRSDVDNEFAIYEDVLKVFGVNNIKPCPIKSTSTKIYDDVESEVQNELRKSLRYNGFYEVKTYNLCDLKTLDFNFFKYKNHIKIKNPISNEKEYLRLSLLSGILNTYSFNSRVNNYLQKIFEIQNVYYENKKEKHLIFSVPSFPINNKLENNFINNDILYCKNILNNVFALFNKKVNYKLDFKDTFGCENDSVCVYCNNELVGYITRLNPQILKDNKINNERVYVCEIKLSSIFKIDNSYVIEEEIYSQNIWKELTFSLEKGITLNDFYNVISKQNLFNHWELISEFKKDGIVYYTITFNLLDNKNVQKSFEEVIELFKVNKFIIKEN